MLLPAPRRCCVLESLGICSDLRCGQWPSALVPRVPPVLVCLQNMPPGRASPCTANSTMKLGSASFGSGWLRGLGPQETYRSRAASLLRSASRRSAELLRLVNFPWFDRFQCRLCSHAERMQRAGIIVRPYSVVNSKNAITKRKLLLKLICTSSVPLYTRNDVIAEVLRLASVEATWIEHQAALSGLQPSVASGTENCTIAPVVQNAFI